MIAQPVSFQDINLQKENSFAAVCINGLTVYWSKYNIRTYTAYIQFEEAAKMLIFEIVNIYVEHIMVHTFCLYIFI